MGLGLWVVVCLFVGAPKIHNIGAYQVVHVHCSNHSRIVMPWGRECLFPTFTSV